MKRLKTLYFLSFFSLLIFATSIPEPASAAPARRRYHHSHHKRYKRNFKKQYHKKRKTIPKDYIIRNHRKYRTW